MGTLPKLWSLTLNAITPNLLFYLIISPSHWLIRVISCIALSILAKLKRISSCLWLSLVPFFPPLPGFLIGSSFICKTKSLDISIVCFCSYGFHGLLRNIKKVIILGRKLSRTSNSFDHTNWRVFDYSSWGNGPTVTLVKNGLMQMLQCEMWCLIHW